LKTTTKPGYIFSKQDTLYFSGPQLAKLRFNDIKANIYTAYNMENINNLCPDKFTLIGFACYRVIYDASYDWNQARAQCDTLKSNLAWFDTNQDLDMVRAWLNKEYLYLTNDVWIGGRAQYSSQSPWFWSIHPFNSTLISADILQPNWAPNQPSSEAQRTALQLSKSNGYLFANQAPEKRLYSILCKKKSFLFDSTNTFLTLNNHINAIDTFGSPLIGYTYLTNISHESSFTAVTGPSIGTYSSVFQRLPIEYGLMFTGRAYHYTNAFTLTLCNDLTTSQIATIRSLIKQAWLQIRQEFVQCNCFDIFIVTQEKFTDPGNHLTTQLSYIARANQLVIETTSSGPIPSKNQIYDTLQNNGFSQCQPRSKRSALLDLNVEGSTLHQVNQSLIEIFFPNLFCIFYIEL